MKNLGVNRGAEVNTEGGAICHIRSVDMFFSNQGIFAIFDSKWRSEVGSCTIVPLNILPLTWKDLDDLRYSNLQQFFLQITQR